MPESNHPPEFEKLLAALVNGRVDFALVGGLAVGLNGFLRGTKDVDILVGDEPRNLEKLLEVLRGWGEGWARELSVEDFTPEEGCIKVSEEFDLDIFTRMTGRSLDDFRQHLKYSSNEAVRVPFLDASAIIELKQHSVREKDQLDVLALRRILQDEKSK